ncbi:MAG: hypothetical protein ACTSV2_00715, partial [Candidatus Thorarchaeota archaeon]
LKLDMDWRRGMMRNHTAEHLFVSSLLHINSDAELGYIWIDGNRGTIEIIGDSVTFEQIIQAETKVQEIIEYDIPVESRLVESLDLDVKVRAREGVSKYEAVRIVSVKGFDHSACSGTHVSKTGDIGTFKVIDYKLSKEDARLEFATSSKALEALSQIYNMVLERKHDYPFEIMQLGHILDKSKKSIDDHRELLDEIQSLLSQSTVTESIKGVSVRLHYLPGFSAQELRETIKKMDHEKVSLTLLFSPGIKCNFVIWMNGLDTNSAATISEIVRKLEGKGGGSRSSYTGGFSDVSSPKELFESFTDAVRIWLNQ